MSVNMVVLVGNLGADPEIRHTQDGRRIANFNLATSESWKDKHTGEKKTRTEWHRVVIFSDGIAGVAEQWLSKGSQVYIRGQNRTRKWTDQSGTDRYTTEVVVDGFDGVLRMLGGGRQDSRDDDRRQQQRDEAPRRNYDDDIPF